MRSVVTSVGMRGFFGRLCAGAGLSLVLVSYAAAGEIDCGVLKNFNDLGPFDYQDPQNRVPDGANPMGMVKRVENVHFQDAMKAVNLKLFSVERLTSEFTYTLRMFPNHPEALYAMSRLESLAGGKLPQKAINVFTPKISADCFFDRAIRFRPEDSAVQLVYGLHLHKRQRYKEALVAYEKAEALGEDSTSLYYNLGLLHTELKNWDKAVGYAQKAYGKGAYFPALRDRIEKAGYSLTVSGKAKGTPSAAPAPRN